VRGASGRHFARTELDTKGVAFEEFMGGFFKGDFGLYAGAS
jgi:type I restriction enzyme M protein